MESLGRLSIFSSVECMGESGSCCGSSSQSVRSGFHTLNYKSRNQDLCRAQKICCASVATERRTSSAGDTRSNDKSLLNAHALDRIRDYGRNTSSFDDRTFCKSKSKVVDKDEDVSGKLDQWVKESVHEILNNLDEAPFLVQIYTDGEDGLASTAKSKSVKVKACPKTWPFLTDRWNGESTTPNGVILVGEIDTGKVDCSNEVNCGGIGVLNKSSSSSSSQSTRVWGILIQGKGGNYPACYKLKTSRVKGLAGVCTHFCLARVECFVEHVDILFKKVWLL